VVTRWWQRTLSRRWLRIFTLIFPIWFDDSKSVITRTLVYFRCGMNADYFRVNWSLYLCMYGIFPCAIVSQGCSTQAPYLW